MKKIILTSSVLKSYYSYTLVPYGKYVCVFDNNMFSNKQYFVPNTPVVIKRINELKGTPEFINCVYVWK